MSEDLATQLETLRHLLTGHSNTPGLAGRQLHGRLQQRLHQRGGGGEGGDWSHEDGENQDWETDHLVCLGVDD